MLTNRKLTDLIQRLKTEKDLIPVTRKEQLNELSVIINDQLQNAGQCDLVVICTHNSRRSQLGEIWLALAAHHFEIEGIRTFSGGTEATAFNHRMVYALQKKGIDLSRVEEGNNPKYVLGIGGQPSSRFLFSKKYDSDFNPAAGFIAIIVCDHANQNCPIVNGAGHRVFISYEDPKAYDDTKLELEKYLGKVDEIGREMIYCLSLVANKITEPS